MQIIISPEEKRFGVALTTALALHLGALLLHIAQPAPTRQNTPGGPMTVTVGKPGKPVPPRANISASKTTTRKTEKTAGKAPHKQRVPRAVPLLSQGPSPVKVPLAPPPPEEKQNWTRAEKEEIDQFFNPTPSKPPSGTELAQRAMAAARNLPPAETVSPQEKRELAQQNARLAQVEPFSMKMYFQSLYTKLNQMSRFVKRTQKQAGRKAAAIRVVLNSDGTVRSFRVLWTADQQAEVAYVNKLFEAAAPFSPFPPPMARVTESLILDVCIKPGDADGADLFSPMEPGSRCY